MTGLEFASKQNEILASIPESFRSWISHQIWEDFHGYGYEEILLHLDDYVDGLKKCLEEGKATESPHSHLTDYQRAIIRDEAIDATFNDAQQDNEYLLSLVVGWIDTMSTEDQVHAISSDEKMWPEVLDFDPRTGEKWDET